MSRLQMKTSKAIRNPKLFVSYSWSNPAHQQWVIALATQLMDAGVDVILDKWELKEGNDAIAFMEKMVADPKILKVIMVFDKNYASKADDRTGGVGTETQIISSEVYEKINQDKFVAVIAENDKNGKPYVPIYYKSRIHIDLSDTGDYARNFEQLLRWIYNKPLHKKPVIGKQPAFLDESKAISLGTTVLFNRAISAIKENKSFASATLNEYLITFSTNLEKFRITEKDGEFDKKLIENIEKFIPYRNEIVSLFVKLAQYMPTEENLVNIHRFFETLIPYMSRSGNFVSHSDIDFDNFKFIVHELFLCLVAIFIKHEKFSEVDMLLTREYYVGDQLNHNNDTMTGYDVFDNDIRSLEYRRTNQLSLHADMLKQRSESSGLEFRYLMQADFVLFMRDVIQHANEHICWFPNTLIYLDFGHRAFEIFARSSSKSYFDKAKCILGIEQLSDIRELMESYRSGERRVPSSRWESFTPALLLGYDQLATKP